MCDAAWGCQGGRVELPEVRDDTSSGCESSSETEEIFPAWEPKRNCSETEEGSTARLCTSRLRFQEGRP
jgi:hypothetical protein